MKTEKSTAIINNLCRCCHADKKTENRTPTSIYKKSNARLTKNCAPHKTSCQFMIGAFGGRV